jgi:hypothetical protein
MTNFTIDMFKSNFVSGQPSVQRVIKICKHVCNHILAHMKDTVVHTQGQRNISNHIHTIRKCLNSLSEITSDQADTFCSIEEVKIFVNRHYNDNTIVLGNNFAINTLKGVSCNLLNEIMSMLFCHTITYIENKLQRSSDLIILECKKDIDAVLTDLFYLFPNEVPNFFSHLVTISMNVKFEEISVFSTDEFLLPLTDHNDNLLFGNEFR